MTDKQFNALYQELYLALRKVAERSRNPKAKSALKKFDAAYKEIRQTRVGEPR